MFLFSPIPPPYDPLEWAKKPFPEKSRMVCLAWALQGYGSPIGVYFFYVFKVALYIGGWIFFCRFTPGMGGLADLSTWWLQPIAFQKAILWSMLFEGIGIGCGSGPLTGRYFPPLGGALYFLRPGTIKLPVFEKLGCRRTWLDVLLYATAIVLLLFALASAAPSRAILIAIAAVVALLGILDKTIFLCARGEHYFTTTMVFVLSSDWIPGAKAVQLALWFWAGFSKLNHHFPSVVGVMTSNSAVIRFPFIRKLMYARYPDDLSPSHLATIMGHMGTALEFLVPLVLVLGNGDSMTTAGLILMLVLHTFITSNVPMGAPIEWNFMVVYAAFFLFGAHTKDSLLSMNLPTAVLAVIMCILVPLLGNLFPGRVPFLLAMRYYAGNWAYSIWLFKNDSYRKLDRLTKTSPWIYDQLERFYPRSVGIGIVGKVMAFRLMHLHGRALAELLPKAVDNLSDYEWVDGEIVAGLALGWNFGDGHLHDEQLLRAIQSTCSFDQGELRCIMVEGQPFLRPHLHYRIHDACTGPIAEGDVSIQTLRTRQPWAWAP